MLTYQELLAQRAGLPLRNRRRNAPPDGAADDRRMDAVERRLARNPALAAKVTPDAAHPADDGVPRR